LLSDIATSIRGWVAVFFLLLGLSSSATYLIVVKLVLGAALLLAKEIF
jgi:hypothetical protein